MRLHDIERKLRRWGYPSHFPDAERDVVRLLDCLAERVAGLEDAAVGERVNVLAIATARFSTILRRR